MKISRIPHNILVVIRHPKRAFRKIDQKLFGGYLLRENKRKEHQRLADEKFRLEHPEEAFDRSIQTHIANHPIIGQKDFSVKDILLAQFEDGQAVFYDIVVRLFAIDQYYKKNDYGYLMYARMQKEAGNGTFWLERFIKLIESCELNGFDESYPIHVDEDLKIFDGAHRLALALYHHKEFIPTIVHQGHMHRRWSINLFWELGFSHAEMKLIQYKAIELFNNCKYSCVGVIWPSAAELSDDILGEIKTYHDLATHPLQNADMQVVCKKSLTLNELEFIGLFRAMYYADAMDEEGITRKLQYIKQCLPEGNDKYQVLIFYLNMLNPKVARNEKRVSEQSYQVAELKKVIRNRFKTRMHNYQYDNILHISDNYKQSKFCDIALCFDKDLSELFQRLNQKYEYFIVKLDERQSVEFPKSFYFYTDVDVVVPLSHVKTIGKEVEHWLFKKYEGLHGGWVHVARRKDEDEQVEIMITIQGWRCFMLHIQTIKHFKIADKFIRDCLTNRVLTNNKIYVLPPKYESIVRISELVQKPQKEWHCKYISKHIADVSEHLVKKAFADDSDYLKKIEHTIHEIKFNGILK